MDRGAWWATVLGVQKSWTQLSYQIAAKQEISPGKRLDIINEQHSIFRYKEPRYILSWNAGGLGFQDQAGKNPFEKPSAESQRVQPHELACCSECS